MLITRLQFIISNIFNSSPFQRLSLDQRNEVLGILSNLLKSPQFTVHVAECFPDILLILLTLAIPLNRESLCDLKKSDILHRINCCILGKLVHEHPDVLRYFISN